jgi:hypothetical protein
MAPPDAPNHNRGTVLLEENQDFWVRFSISNEAQYSSVP